MLIIFICFFEINLISNWMLSYSLKLLNAILKIFITLWIAYMVEKRVQIAENFPLFSWHFFTSNYNSGWRCICFANSFIPIFFFSYYERFHFFSSNPRSLIIFFAIVFFFFFFKKPQRVHSSWTWGDAERTRARFQNNNLLPPHSEAQATLFLISSRKSQSIYYGRSPSFLPSFILYLLAIIRLPLFVRERSKKCMHATGDTPRKIERVWFARERGFAGLFFPLFPLFFFYSDRQKITKLW